MRAAAKFALTALVVILGVNAVVGADSSISASYRKHRDLGHRALGNADYGLARTNLLAAFETLAPQGFKHPLYAESLAEVAAFHCERGRAYSSRRYAETLRDYYLVRKGTNSLDAAYACFLFGQVQLQLHKFAAAEKALLRAKAIAEQEVGVKSLPVAHTMARLGQLYVWMKQDEKAIGFLEAGLKGMASPAGDARSKPLLRLSRSAFLKPDAVAKANLMLELVLAFNAVGRKEEGQATLDRVQRLLAKVDSGRSPKFHALKQAGHTLEARGNWRAAEAHFYAAARVLWENEKLSPREKLRGHELVLEFHVRAGQDAKASTMEGILFGRGVSEDYLHELNLRCEQLSFARDGGPHKRY